MKAVLLVTWLLGAQVSSYQVPFDNIEHCNAARVAILQDASTMVAGEGLSRPRVSAVCAEGLLQSN